LKEIDETNHSLVSVRPLLFERHLTLYMKSSTEEQNLLYNR